MALVAVVLAAAVLVQQCRQQTNPEKIPPTLPAGALLAGEPRGKTTRYLGQGSQGQLSPERRPLGGGRRSVAMVCFIL